VRFPLLALSWFLGLWSWVRTSQPITTRSAVPVGGRMEAPAERKEPGRLEVPGTRERRVGHTRGVVWGGPSNPVLLTGVPRQVTAS